MTILTKKIHTFSEQETFNLGRKTAHYLSPADRVGFIGELGSGKTAFIKGILSGLGYEPENVCSASFVLVQEYKAKYPVVHIDLYRLSDKNEVLSLGWDSYLSSENIVLIEWADKALGCFDFSLRIDINIISDSEREFLFTFEDGDYQELSGAL